MLRTDPLAFVSVHENALGRSTWILCWGLMLSMLGCGRSTSFLHDGGDALDAWTTDAGPAMDGAVARDVGIDGGTDAGADAGVDAGPPAPFVLLGATARQEGGDIVVQLERWEDGRARVVTERSVAGRFAPAALPTLRSTSDGSQVLLSVTQGTGSERWRWIPLDRPEVDLPIPFYDCVGGQPIVLGDTAAFGCGPDGSTLTDRHGAVLGETVCGAWIGSLVHDRFVMLCGGRDQLVDGRGALISAFEVENWGTRIVGPDRLAVWVVEPSRSYHAILEAGEVVAQGPEWPAAARSAGFDATGEYAMVLIDDETHLAHVLDGPGEPELRCRRDGGSFAPDAPVGMLTCEGDAFWFDAAAGTVERFPLPVADAGWYVGFHHDARWVLLDDQGPSPAQIFDRETRAMVPAWPGREPTIVRWERAAPR